MHSRTRSGVTPVAACSCSVSWECVVVAGWIAKTADVADIREMAEKLEALDEAASGFFAALDAESEDRAAASGKVARLACMPGAGGESGVTHPLDLVACFEPFGHGKGVGDVPLHPDTEGLEALEEEERVQRRDRRADIAQVLKACFQDVLGRTERFGQL